MGGRRQAGPPPRRRDALPAHPPAATPHLVRRGAGARVRQDERPEPASALDRAARRACRETEARGGQEEQRVSWDHSPCWWASTNQSHLSTPREISVRMSALPASSSSFISSIPSRTVRPNPASASDSAATCSAPVERVNG